MSQILVEYKESYVSDFMTLQKLNFFVFFLMNGSNKYFHILQPSL